MAAVQQRRGPVGILLVDKRVGVTSHGVVARIRRTLGVRRVGHAGTLDPDASGLLLVGVGSATRLLTFLVGLDKTYTATIRLGIATETDDAAGRVLSAVGCTLPLDLESTLVEFRGSIQQRPSAVSAVKVGGRRAYARVRAGEDVALPPREVTIHRLEVLGVRAAEASGAPVVDVDVELDVSSGTYVRAVARDVGEVLGVGGHLTSLRRTSVGPFDVADAVALDEVTPELIRPAGQFAAAVLPTCVVPAADTAAVRNGTKIPVPAEAPEGSVALLDESGALLAVATAVEGRWRYECVVP